jgi:transposase-like protein
MATQEDMTIPRFLKMYGSEKACREHLFNIRWPSGFKRPHCGHTEYYDHKNRNLYQCKKCGYQASVTAGTVTHKTHIPLAKWFLAIYLAGQDKRGVSAVRLEQELGISYPSAWLMLHKIRKAMGDREGEYQLGGLVEMDEAYFGGAKSGGKRGRGTEKAPVLVAVSLDEKEKPRFVKMSVGEDVTADSLPGFAEKAVKEGSAVRSDGFSSYPKAFSEGKYRHDPIKHDPNEKPEHLRWLHTIVSNAKSFILGTCHGLDSTRFHAYLNEFCYRMNRRFFTALLFNRLLYACASASTITYKQLVSETS